MKTTKEKAEIMLAFDRGEKVECQAIRMLSWTTLPSDKEPAWDWHNFDYRIAVKPKEKIKMLCWTNGSILHWRNETLPLPCEPWTRFPAGDLEGKVEE